MDPTAAKTFILHKLKVELPPQRTYHCLEHTHDVYASVIDIAEQEGVGGEDLVLLKVAALFHDSGFLLGDHEHEVAGCRIVEEQLPGFGFNPTQLDRIQSMIMATKVPQSPKDHLERILCDADLDYLGRNDFKRIGDTLYQELRNYGQIGDLRTWNDLQVRFLENHRYFTDTNLRLREPMKQTHLAALREWLTSN